MEASVTAIDSLMLEAKQAILDEHHRRFQTLHKEGRWDEAIKEIHVTLTCATDLLYESARVLEEALDNYPAIPLPLPQPRKD